MRVMGLDCATLKSGISVVSSVNGEATLIHAEKFERPSRVHFTRRIYDLKKRVIEQVEEFQPDLVVLEDIKFNRNAPNLGSMAKVAMTIGAVASEVAGADQRLEMITATSARKILETKNKDSARKMVNKKFLRDLIEIGFPDGLKKAHEDVSDSIVLAWGGLTLL
jgi:Holliday junction resolvasome RuvABC endonuclease subunit